MKAEEYREREIAVGDWEVNLSSYRVGAEWHAKADDVSPGATLARSTGATREEAELKVLQKAEELLGRTKRHVV